MTKKYDYIAIGGGSGGIASINRAASYGMKCALIEAKELGGTCVNVGCVPKKVMWYGSQIAEAMKLYAPDYGYDVTVDNFDFKKLIASREAYIDRIHQSYDRGLANNKVDVIKGYATFVDEHTIEVNGELLTAEHILIATGGKPTWPTIPGAELGIDSDGFFALEELPKRVAVVGAGYIAVEVAGVLHGLGSDTHLFIRHDKPLRSFDPYVVDGLVESMAKEGPTLHPHSLIKEVTKNKDKSLTLHLKNGESYVVDQVIWAIGRTPVTETLKLENTAVTLTEKGHIKVDKFQNTSVAGIYAVGDITGHLELTPVAVAKRDVDYPNVYLIINLMNT